MDRDTLFQPILMFSNHREKIGTSDLLFETQFSSLWYFLLCPQFSSLPHQYVKMMGTAPLKMLWKGLEQLLEGNMTRSLD